MDNSGETRTMSRRCRGQPTALSPRPQAALSPRAVAGRTGMGNEKNDFLTNKKQ